MSAKSPELTLAATATGEAVAPVTADGKRKAAFFDIDQTLVKGASTYHVAKALYRRGFFGKRDILFFALHATLYQLFGENRRSINRISRRALRIVEGHNESELIAVTDEIYDRVLKKKIFPGSKRILDQHLEDGDEVWLISAAPSLVSDLIAQRLHATGAIGTRVRVDGHGNFMSQFDGELMHRRGKAIAAIKLASSRDIDLGASHAYGDSINDLPLLQTVGTPTAVNPEPLLRLVALDKNWPIFDFRPPRIDYKSYTKKMLGTAVGAVLVSSLVRHFTRWF